MGYVIRMPQLGMSMELGTVVEWTVGEGASVAEGDTLCVIESEKTSADVEAREAGVLRRAIVAQGESVEPGAAIGILAGPDEDLSAYASQVDADLDAASDDTGTGSATAGGGGAESAVSSAGDDDAATTGVAASSSSSSSDVRASPGAKRAASEAGVDLATVEGTGPQGVVTEADVERAAASSGTDGRDDADVRASPGAKRAASEAGISLTTVEGTGPQGVVTEADVERAVDAGEAGGSASSGATRTVTDARTLAGMQGVISERLGESYREAVHVTLNRAYDTTTLREAVDTAEDAGIDVSLTDLLVKAVGGTLEEYPAFNALFEDDEHRLIEEVNVGVAVDVDGGLVTPVIADVDELSAAGVKRERRALTERVQSGSFTMDDLEGGTFTISNLGVFGVDHFDPVINPPQVAILGVGRIRDDATMTLSLSFDHRVVNGADAARFLGSLCERLTDEETLASYVEADLGDESQEPRTAHVRTESGYAGRYRAAGTEVRFDEPESMGGGGTAPGPVEHLLGALGSCLSLSVREMAKRDEVTVETIETSVQGAPEHGPLESVTVELHLATDADEDTVDRMVLKAERACYVARSLSDDIGVSLSWSRL